MAGITVRSKQITPVITPTPAQPGLVQAGAPIVDALDVVGRTVSELGKISGQLEARDVKRQAQLEKLRLEGQEKSDRADATDAVTLSKGAINEQFINYKARKGRTAQGVTVDYDTFAKELFNKSMEGLKTNEAKQLYAEDMLAVNINSHNSALQHESDEGAKVNVSAAESSILNSIQTSTINFENPLSYTIERANIEDQIDILSGLEGWDKETKQRNLNDSMVKLEEGRIRQWSITNAKVAKELFAINKDIFNLDKQDELNKLLDKDETAQDARSSVISLRDQFPNDLNKQIETAEKDKSLSPEASKETIIQLRKRSNDDKAKKDAESLALNDQVTGDIDDILRDPKRNNADAYLSANDAPTEKDQRAQRKYIDTELKRLEGDIITDPDKLTEYYSNPQQFKSIGDVRRATSILSKKDAADFETWWQNGGTVGGLSESEIRSAFLTYSGNSAADIPVTYQNARRFIVSMAESLTPGQTVTSTNLDTWMRQAVRGEADNGNLPTRESINVTSRLTEKQRGNVVSQMEAGNDARIKAGKQPYPINAGTIAKASLNVYPNLRKTIEPTVEPTVIVAPEPVSAFEPLTEVERKARLPQQEETVRPFKGSTEPLSPRKIKEESGEIGDVIDDREALLLAVNQYPESLQTEITTILKQEIPEQRIQEQIDDLLKASGFAVIPKPERRPRQ